MDRFYLTHKVLLYKEDMNFQTKAFSHLCLIEISHNFRNNTMTSPVAKHGYLAICTPGTPLVIVRMCLILPLDFLKFR